MNKHTLLTLLTASCLVALLFGCDQSPAPAEPGNPQVVADAVDAVSAVAGESEDDSAICGKLEPLLSALPATNAVDGLAESYRGCESPMTANLQYEDAGRGIYYTISVLRAEQADLPAEGEHWQGLLDMNRQAIESLMATQQAMIEVGRKPVVAGAADPLSETERARLPREVVLPNGATGLMFNDGQDWTLVSLMKDRYILRVDLLNYMSQADNTDAAEALLMARVADIDFARLP